MKTRPPKKREDSRAKAVLSMREAQFRLAVKAFKEIVEFRGAHLSVFETEVHLLQQVALRALVNMENVQRTKPLITSALRRTLVPPSWKPLIDPVFEPCEED